MKVMVVVGVLASPLVLVLVVALTAAAVPAGGDCAALTAPGVVAPGASGPQPGSGRRVLSAGRLAALAARAGFRGADLVTAVAVALAESEGDPSARNVNSDGSTDYGLWQINSVHVGAGGFDTLRAFDPAYNARFARGVWDRAADGPSDGRGAWTPWVTYNEGLHRRFLPAAQRAAAGAATAGEAVLATSDAAVDACTLAVGESGDGSLPAGVKVPPYSILRDPSARGTGNGGPSVNLLDPTFKRQIARLETLMGAKLQVTSGYRTAAYQAALCRRVSGPCAPPGRSLHQQGLAVDAVNWRQADPYLERLGLCNDVPNDAVHISAGWGDRPCA